MGSLINLRKPNLFRLGYENIAEWMKNPNHLYIGRKIRIFIHNKIPAIEAPGSKNKRGQLDLCKAGTPLQKSNSREESSILEFAPGSYIDKKGFVVEYYQLSESIWANPFSISKTQDRETVVKLYKDYVVSNSDLVKELPSLKGKTLGCWCAPEGCHGDVLLQL